MTSLISGCVGSSCLEDSVFVLYLRFYFYVFSYMYVCVICVQCLQSLKGALDHLERELQMWAVGTETRSSGWAAGSLN